jgi:hypothetical protein
VRLGHDPAQRALFFASFFQKRKALEAQPKGFKFKVHGSEFRVIFHFKHVRAASAAIRSLPAILPGLRTPDYFLPFHPSPVLRD